MIWLRRLSAKNITAIIEWRTVYVHNEADAADIVQEGAYRAIKYCDALKNEAYASTWIYRIMLNEVFRFLGAKKRGYVGRGGSESILKGG